MDWLTHICVAYLTAVILKIKKDREFILLGAILPDTYKLQLIFFPFFGYSAVNFFAAFHTLLGFFLTAVFVATFFKFAEKAKIFTLLFVGGITHFILDSLLWPFGKILYIFLPFWYGYTEGWIWPESFIPTLIVVPISGIVLFLEKRFFKKK